MVKAGQVYSHSNGLRYCITQTDNTGFADYISSLGTTYCEKKSDLIGQLGMLIAEYPTWQEAVNSYEFQGVDKPRKWIRISKRKYEATLRRADYLKYAIDEAVGALNLISKNSHGLPSWSKYSYISALEIARSEAQRTLNIVNNTLDQIKELNND